MSNGRAFYGIKQHKERVKYVKRSKPIGVIKNIKTKEGKQQSSTLMVNFTGKEKIRFCVVRKMNKSERSKTTKKILIDIGVNFSLLTPFRLSSGFLSPSYIDCRKIIAYPSAFKSITDMMIDSIKSDMISQSPNYIIGGETAGIPFGAVIAEKMGIPFSYVRKKAKDYGKSNLIEGEIFKEKNSLLVEDLMTDGRSKINFVENIRSHGVQCDLSLVVFKYNIFKDADLSMKNNNIEVHYLTDWEDVYNQMCNMNVFDSNILLEIRKFLNDPVSWSNDKNQIK